MVSELLSHGRSQSIGICLNPCSCGGWSQRSEFLLTSNPNYGLNPCSCGGWSQSLIKAIMANKNGRSLNPCCGGRWSQSTATMEQYGYKTIVLILVVVEDGLRGHDSNGNGVILVGS